MYNKSEEGEYMIHIAIISESFIVNKGLSHTLSDIPHFEIITSTSFEEAYSIDYMKVDFIILYFNHETAEHYLFNHFIHNYYPTIKILLLLPTSRLTSAPSSFLHLADATLMINTTSEQLVKKIEQLVSSEKTFYEKSVGISADERELLLLYFLQENFTNKKIASYFNVSERTVERYFQKLYSLYKVRNKKELYMLLYTSKN